MIDKAFKKAAIRIKGGCCALCGYNRCWRALHFHHLDPSQKSFNISQQTDFTKLELELEKCILLCANCHAEVEDGFVKL